VRQRFVLSFAILWLSKQITRFTVRLVFLTLSKVLMLVSRFSADSVVDVDVTAVAFAHGVPTSIWIVELASSNSKT
jgi:hypothetical protein